MKTITAHIEKTREFQAATVQDHFPEVSISISEILALLSAVTVATAAIMLSIWVAGMNSSSLIGAGTWGVGFIFFALAIDSRVPAALLQLSTGASLLVLAWLQFAVSPEYTVVSGVIIAAWIAVAVFRRLK